MIKEFIEIYRSNEDELEAIAVQIVEEKKSIELVLLVEILFLLLDEHSELPFLLEDIEEVSLGGHKGHVLFFIAVEHSWGTSDRIYHTNMGYGSCSVCDVMEDINFDMKSEPVETKEKIMRVFLTLVERIDTLKVG